jgi:hypothetical protein
MKIFCLLALVLAQAPQSEVGVVRGTVVKAGSSAPIADATLTLNVELPSSIQESLKAFVATTGFPPGEAQSVLAGMMRSTPEFLERQLAQARATNQGPAALIDLFSQVLAVKTSAKGFPMRAVSDANGQFTFSGVPRGAFTLLVHSDRDFGSARNGAPHGDHYDVSLPVPVRDLQTTVTVPMIPGAVISGRLRDANGRAAPNVPISLLLPLYFNGTPGLVADTRSTKTDDSGQFRMFWLTPGEYFISATPQASDGAFTTFYPGSLDPTTATRINVAAGQEITNMDFSLQTAQAVTLSGEVTEDGSPTTPRSLTVRLIRRPETGASPITKIFPVVDGQKAAFEFRGVPPGTYQLVANTAPNFRNTTSIEVRDKDVTGIQVLVHPNVTMNGVVTLDGVAPPPSAGARVSLRAFDPDGKTIFEETISRDGVPIAAEGKVTLPNNPWGHYATRILGFPPDAYVDEVQQGAVNVYDSGVNVPGDPITVKVKSNGGRIEGVVQTADKKPLSRATVVLVPPAPRRRNPALYKSTETDNDGHFSLRGIQPGEYKLFAWEDVPESAWLNAEYLAKYETQARAVSVTPSAKMELEIVAAR